MRRPRSPLMFIRSVITVLVALVLLGTVGLAPAGAVPVGGEAPPGSPSVVSSPLLVPHTEHAASSPFADVAVDHVFSEEISWLAATGVSTGWAGPGGTRLFRPYQATLRDQMAAFLYRTAGSPAFEAPVISPFADVPTDHVFYEEISWLAETGISTGWAGPEGTRQFRPSQPVLRDQMAAFLYRMAGSPAFEAPATSPFADVPTDHVFYEEISWLAETGVSTGWPGPGGTRQFRVYQSTLRDQMAAFLYRVDPLLPGRNTPTAEVASSYDSAYVIRADGTVWAWGQNHHGQLGNATTTDTTVPVQVVGLSGVQSLETNTAATYALKADGTVWAWGWNHAGMLGNGTGTDSSVPVPVPGLSDVESIETNGSGVFAITTEGTVWAWGSNRFGQLGTGIPTDSLVPVQVTGLPPIRSITADGVSTYALTTEGTVWAWGLNTGGQPGTDTYPHTTVPIQVTGLSEVESLAAQQSSVYAVKSDGTVWTWGSNYAGQPGEGTSTEAFVPVQVTGLSDIEAVEVQYGSGYALKSDGTVWTWTYGGPPDNDTTTDAPAAVQVPGLTRVVSIETNHGPTAYAVTTDGEVWAWGGNRYGELGNGTTTDSPDPVQVTGLANVESVESFTYSAYALTTDGEVWSWGWNQVGQLGNGTRTDSTVPVPVSRLNG